VTGVKIQHLSAYPTEAEVLLAAGTRFVVTQTLTNGDLTIVNLKEVSSGLLVCEDIPSEPEPQPEPELGSLPADIRTLAALSKATGENEADLLEYSEKDLEAVFGELHLSTVGKVRIKREMVALRELLQTEPEPEPAEPEPEPAEPEPQPQPTYTEITTLSGHRAPTAVVFALAIHDSKLYSGSEDNTIKVWSLEAGDFGREITTLSGHTNAVMALAIHDSKLYSGSLDKTIKVWSLDAGE
jgi:hypothetical protein